MTTDTPRTDTRCYNYDSEWATMTCLPCGEHVQASFSRQLELELAASKAEVESLKANLRWGIEIAERLSSKIRTDGWLDEEDELDALKATINQDNK